MNRLVSSLNGILERNTLLDSPWWNNAQTAVWRYQHGLRCTIKAGTFPVPKATGWCAMAAHALRESVTGVIDPFAHIDENHDGHMTANDMCRLMLKAGQATAAGDGGNAFHTAKGLGKLTVGSKLFFPDGEPGHVATVIAIRNDGSALSDYTVFENTSATRLSAGGARGTIISKLDEVCGGEGSDRIVAVGHAPS